MISIKLGELADSAGAIQELMAKELGGRAAYRVARNIQAINKELEPFQSAVGILRSKYLVTQENWANPKEPEFLVKDGAAGFAEEIEELRTEIVEVDIAPIAIKEIERIQIAPVAIAQMMWMFEEQGN